MRQLKLNHNGETRLFQADGTVAVIEGGAPVVKGKWRAQSQGGEPQDNQIRYQIDNVDQPPVPVNYSFNKFNQLVSVIPAAANGGADSEPCAWLGQIHIDDASDLNYSLLNDDGSALNNQLTVYGKLHFAADTADLVIDLARGGQATIEGEKTANGISVLTAEKNLVAEFDAQDLLRFVARTRNDFAGLTSRIPTKADIKFLGQWDVDPNTGGLIFVSKVAGDINKPDVAIGFAGKLKAVTVGFAYFADKHGEQLAFTIQGSHRWNATETSFELSLGHTEKKFLADFSGNIARKGASGQQFVLGGSVKIKHEDGAGTDLDLNIEGSYAFDDKNRLIFRAAVSSVNGALNYDLQLEGKFVYKGGTLNFLVRVSSAGPSPKVQIQLAFSANKDELKTMLALALDISKDQVKISFEFELRMRFKGGALIKDKPKELKA
ncbi:MAG: hypothetical protein JMDDDDMK_02529 [Acidobacteria bacterium]|nr:hypothetical protein [Acidobacteriota bacterium]